MIVLKCGRVGGDLVWLEDPVCVCVFGCVWMCVCVRVCVCVVVPRVC